MTQASAAGDFVLVRPATEHLSSYVAALERGWSPDTVRDEAGREALQKIAQSHEKFLDELDDPQAKAGPVKLPDGSFVPRLPGFVRWMWDGEFAGSIGLRWTPGSAELPPTCPGHVGYTVVPWKRGRGYAKAALALMLPEARKCGLSYVEVVTDVENVASQRVILANGGVLIERFTLPPENGRRQSFRFRIPIDSLSL